MAINFTTTKFYIENLVAQTVSIGYMFFPYRNSQNAAISFRSRVSVFGGHRLKPFNLKTDQTPETNAPHHLVSLLFF